MILNQTLKGQILLNLGVTSKREEETHFLHVIKNDHYNDIVNKKRCYTQFYDNLANISPDKAQYFTRFIAIEKTTPKHYVLITKYIESTSLYIFLLNKQNIANKEVEAKLIQQISTYCTVFNESTSFCNMLVAQDGDDIISMPIDFQHDENDLSLDDIKQHNKNIITNC